MSAISDLEPVVHELRATTTILDAMIDANRENHQLGDKEDYAWAKVAGELSDLAQRVVDLWHTAFDQHRDEIPQLKAEHTAKIAELKSKKAAPDSKEDIDKADNCWR